MKNFLFILTLLFGMLLFVPEEVQNNDTTPGFEAQKEAVMKEKGVADMQHNLEILSSDLKGSNCLTPRRTAQSPGNTLNIRLLKIEERAIQYFRLKEINLLRKVSEGVTICQTINFSTLLCRMGYHVYGLRKIII
ncbi:MAG: hypothetical protein EGQ00_17085 [Parabacteroides johnsonii]|nr:hypothetical protein [Parabacteroides johnsonii]